MKKIRHIPFGYRYVQGKIVESPSEVLLIQAMYQRYLQGESIQKLAQYADQSGIPYRDNANGWNKNMVTRILEDERYWKKEQYPPIISKELADEVLKLKISKIAFQSKIKFTQKRLTCSFCENKLVRNKRKVPKTFWSCSQCHIHIGPITDDELLQAITTAFMKICRDPGIVKPDQTVSSSLSMEAARLTNEINQMMDRREVDRDAVVSLILECAAEKYKACHIKEEDHQTLNIQKLLEGHGEDEKLDEELFEQIIDKVILQPDCSVRLCLINQKVIE